MREELDRAENEIARIAGRKHGVVYAVGHAAPSEYQRFMATVHVTPPSSAGKAPKRGVVLHRSETDFFDYHRGHQAFEDDHQRELELRRLGYTVRRYTGAQLDNYPAEIVVDMGEVLSRRPRS